MVCLVFTIALLSSPENDINTTSLTPVNPTFTTAAFTELTRWKKGKPVEDAYYDEPLPDHILNCRDESGF